MEQEKDGEKEWKTSHVKTEKESEIDEYLEERLAAIDTKAYLVERLLTSDLPMHESEKEARRDVQTLGPSFVQDSEIHSGEVHMGRERKSQRGEIQWGLTFPLGDCEVQDLSIGPLHYKAIDNGDRIRMSERLRKATSNVEKSESNQCVLLHLAAGAIWNRGGRKLGIPELSKILLETEEWRMAEVLQAKHALQYCEGIDNVFAQELLSLSRDVLSTGHDRDYRSISVFPNEHL